MDEAGRAHDAADWREGRDGAAGLALGLPFAVVPARGTNDIGGELYGSTDGRFRLDTFAFKGTGQAGLNALADLVASEVPALTVTYRQVRPGLLVLVGRNATDDLLEPV